MWNKLRALTETDEVPAPSEQRPIVSFPAACEAIQESTLSPTTDITVVSSKIFIKPPPRTAMGDYIVPEGGQPLTSLGDAYPGPADYFPKIDLTKRAAPQIKVTGKPKLPDEKRDVPGPSEYNTAADITWTNKTLSLKDRRKCFFDEQAAKSISPLGKYNVKYKGVGSEGPKYKMGCRADSNTYTGPANQLVHPVDTKGFTTPGPNYRPNSSYWGRGLNKSFGDKLKDAQPHCPGPADYNVKTSCRGPSHSFGMKLPPPVAVQITVNKFSPAANTYDLGTTVGTSPAISITGRPRDQIGSGKTPCSSTYYPSQDTYNKYRAHALTYRWFDPEERRHPGPADHHVKHVTLPSNPKFTCRQRVKNTYPDSVTCAREPDENPGPGAYNIQKEFVKNSRPAFSLRQHLDPPNDNRSFPGPNRYEPEKQDKPGSKKAPSFSMGHRLQPPNSMKDTPGPGQYSPVNRSHRSDKGKYTMTSRRNHKDCFVNPVAPNKYSLPEVISGKKKGVVFKSRASPFVYSGFRSNKVENPRLPLIAQ